MEHRQIKRVEDYTTASLVLLFINLLWIFGVIWAYLGFAAVILSGLVFNNLITRIEAYRASREIRWPSDA